MTKKASLVAFVFFIVSFYFLFQKTICINEQDKKEWNDLLKSTHSTKGVSRSIKQTRKNIQKDIYFNNDQDLFHTKITSRTSDIDLTIVNKKIKVVEELFDIEFWMQEKFENNSQKIKYCNAKHGKYFFPSHEFVSDEVNLVFFHSKGKELSDMFDLNEILMKARAKQVFFQLNPKGASFKADHINAILPEELNQNIKKRIFHAKDNQSEENL